MIGEAIAAVEPLVLASRSPQRRAILTQLGIRFNVVEPDYEEIDPPGAAPEELVVAHAAGKARSVSAGGWVLGVDTTVALDGRSLGKPASGEEAAAMLRDLAGRRHHVHSGLCLRQAGGGAEEHTLLASTAVDFRPLDEPDIAWYVASGEWRERAGGYAIQGLGAALVERIEGDHSNVVGLPVTALLTALDRARATGG